MVAIEVKSSKTFNKQFLKGLSTFSELAKESTVKGYVVYNGEQEQAVNGIHVVHYRNLPSILETL